MLQVFPSYANFKFTPVVPELYTGTKSFEQFAREISCEYNKLIHYVDAMSDTVNKQYETILQLQEELKTLVNQDTTEYIEDSLQDESSILYNIVDDTITQWSNDRTAQVDANTAAIEKFENGETYADLESNGFVYREV